MPTVRVVVVEDEPAIRRGVSDALRLGGYDVTEAADGAVGLREAAAAGVDLVLLDLLLPRLDGLEVLTELRRACPTRPVIILTARGGEDDRVRGLKMGADDYVVKPFSARELLARVEAVLRRTLKRPPDVHMVDLGRGRIDLRRREVRWSDADRTDLSETEAALLQYLVGNRERAVSREELLHARLGDRHGRAGDAGRGHARRPPAGEAPRPRRRRRRVGGDRHRPGARVHGRPRPERAGVPPMTRRLRGPLGGLLTFLVVAALVVGGLGWVTVAALRVEAAQRDAAHQADLANNLRVALWRLDGGMFPMLGLEDSRPYEHYSAVCAPFTNAIATDAGAALAAQLRVPSPLISARLPEWMTLHFQIDPHTGWESPQVLPDEMRRLLKDNGSEPAVANATPERARVLAELRTQFRVADVTGCLAARESATPSDSPPLAVNLLWQDDPETLSNASGAAPAPSSPSLDKRAESKPAVSPDSGTIRLWGLPLKSPNLSPMVPTPPQASAQAPAPSALLIGNATQNFRFNGKQLRDAAANNEYTNRAQIMSQSLSEQKSAYEGNNLGKNAFGNGTVFDNSGTALSGIANPAARMPGMAASSSPSAGPAKESVARPDETTDAKHAERAKVGPSGRSAGPAASATTSEIRGGASGVAASWPTAAAPVAVHVGAMRTHWLKGSDGSERLALVRTTRQDNRVIYQGVLLDWDKLRGELSEKVRDLFPEAKLEPVREPAGVMPERAMTALPVQLDPGTVAGMPPELWTPLRYGLVLAWAAALIALAAVGLGGWSVIDLSERRIRFVSAVTHELRTPLTSLRLYLDLLTSGMVNDEERRREYLATLNTESDRLHRLIDNVLDFARLENRPTPADKRATPVPSLLDQIRETWRDRCAADGRELVVVSTLPPDCQVSTDPQLLQQIVGNLIDNARKYSREASDKRIWLWARRDGADRLLFEVEDRGPGVALRERSRVFHPFRRGVAADTTAGGAGLGLALARRWAEALGGRLTYRPADGGVGACFRLQLPASR